MKFKGFNFRRTRNVTTHLPTGETNVQFYRINANKRDEGIVVPGKTWTDTGKEVRGVLISLKGHSLTNMAYGADHRVYLAKDGCVYTAPY